MVTTVFNRQKKRGHNGVRLKIEYKGYVLTPLHSKL